MALSPDLRRKGAPGRLAVRASTDVGSSTWTPSACMHAPLIDSSNAQVARGQAEIERSQGARLAIALAAAVGSAGVFTATCARPRPRDRATAREQKPWRASANA